MRIVRTYAWSRHWVAACAAARDLADEFAIAFAAKEPSGYERRRAEQERAVLLVRHRRAVEAACLSTASAYGTSSAFNRTAPGGQVVRHRRFGDGGTAGMR